MNTNRISTDIKHAKEALEKKLDSLQTGMDGIPNLLTPSFDSIKNVLGTITTKVDNVRGGVDLNHTALTDLQQRLTAVEGSVGQVQQDVGKVQAEMMQGIPSGIKIKEIKSNSYTNMTPVLKVSGTGSVHFVRFEKGESWCKFAVKTDGVTRVEVANGYSTIGFFSTLSSIYGLDSKSHPCNVFSDTASDLDGIDRYIDASTKGSQSISEDIGSVVGNSPLVFSQSLEILIGPYGSASSCSNGLVVAYTLDE